MLFCGVISGTVTVMFLKLLGKKDLKPVREESEDRTIPEKPRRGLKNMTRGLTKVSEFDT